MRRGAAALWLCKDESANGLDPPPLMHWLVRGTAAAFSAATAAATSSWPSSRTSSWATCPLRRF